MAGQAAQRAGFGERAARLLVEVRAQAQVGDVAERMLRTRGGDGVGDVFGQPADLAQAEADRGLILAGAHLGATRSSEERRVGKECVRTCSTRGSPFHQKKKKQNTRVK